MSGHFLITGGSRGIGAAIVRAAARAGHEVSFTYHRDTDAATRLVAECGPRVDALQADVADTSAAETVVDTVARNGGEVTVLVNNAGITGPLGDFLSISEAKVREVLDVNVFGLWAMTAAVVRYWRAHSLPGVVINLSSIAATTGAPGEYVGYAASKAAVEAITRGVGRELAPDIRVVGIAPGTTDTDIHTAAGDPGRPRRVVERIPLGRIATADEIAAAVLFAAGEDASYLTATTITVAGGL
jgi:NAD(P)-dependent dehydrogenase (short-subunit alcohol dehydrogenase family)